VGGGNLNSARLKSAQTPSLIFDRPPAAFLPRSVLDSPRLFLTARAVFCTPLGLPAWLFRAPPLDANAAPLRGQVGYADEAAGEYLLRLCADSPWIDAVLAVWLPQLCYFTRAA